MRQEEAAIRAARRGVVAGQECLGDVGDVLVVHGHVDAHGGQRVGGDVGGRRVEDRLEACRIGQLGEVVVAHEGRQVRRRAGVPWSSVEADEAELGDGRLRRAEPADVDGVAVEGLGHRGHRRHRARHALGGRIGDAVVVTSASCTAGWCRSRRQAPVQLVLHGGEVAHLGQVVRCRRVRTARRPGCGPGRARWPARSRGGPCRRRRPGGRPGWPHRRAGLGAGRSDPSPEPTYSGTRSTWPDLRRRGAVWRAPSPRLRSTV